MSNSADSILTIRLDVAPHGLNGAEGLIRQHFRDAKRIKALYTALILSQRPRGWRPINRPCRVVYTRYTHLLMDWDNACSSFKHVGDALTAAGIIADDKPAVLAVFTPRQVKVPRSEAQRITVEFFEINPTEQWEEK